MALIAEWKGDSANGQLYDSTGNGNALVVYNNQTGLPGGSIDNPGTPTPPQGDRWLGHYLAPGGQSFGHAFYVPATAKPNDDQGYISFYVKFTANGHPVIGSAEFINLYNSDSTRYFLIYGDGGNQNELFLEFTDSTGADHFLQFDNGASVMDGNTHLVLVDWNVNGVRSYIDSIQDLGASEAGANIDFGVGVNSVQHDIFHHQGAGGFEYWFDDAIFSNTSIDPNPSPSAPSSVTAANIPLGGIAPQNNGTFGTDALGAGNQLFSPNYISPDQFINNISRDF